MRSVFVAMKLNEQDVRNLGEVVGVWESPVKKVGVEYVKVDVVVTDDPEAAIHFLDRTRVVIVILFTINPISALPQDMQAELKKYSRRLRVEESIFTVGRTWQIIEEL